jgi:glycosyltransferase involved in cell wall biosynthesis
MINLASGFLEQDILVHFVFIENVQGQFEEEIKSFKYLEFNKKGLFGAFFPFLKYLKKEKPDVVLSVLTPANLLALFVKIFSDISFKLLVSVQVAVNINQSTTKIKALWRPFLYRFLYRFADVVVASSLGVSKDLEKMGVSKDKICYIYNPIISEKILEKSNLEIKHPWLDEIKYPVLIAVGRLHKQKDFKTLLNAFALVLKKIDARLIVLGEGEDRTMLENKAKELGIFNKVSFYGFMNNPLAFVKKSSIFVLSSAWEGFGNVVAESLAVGTPVVSTDCPWGPAEILEYGKYGKLVPVGDFFMLADNILKTLEEDIDKSFLKNRAERFSVTNITKEYLELIESIK